MQDAIRRLDGGLAVAGPSGNSGGMTMSDAAREKRDGGPPPTVAGLILAGGRGRRMGGPDKPLAELGGRRLIDHVIARIAPQVAGLAINLSGDASRFAGLGLPLVADLTEEGRIEAFAGPLAGVLSGLEWAATQGGAIAWLAVFPADTPFLPRDFVERAMAAVRDEGADLAVAESGGRVHPTVALWPLALKDRLRRLIVEEGVRRADRLLDAFRAARVVYAAAPVDPFFNVNTPEDLETAERLIA